jgi:hypothetical protein
MNYTIMKSFSFGQYVAQLFQQSKATPTAVTLPTMVIPNEDLYRIFETIRQQHIGRTRMPRGYESTSLKNKGASSAKKHPLLSCPYFSGIDNSRDTPVPCANTDPKAQAEYRLTLEKALRFKKAPPRPSQHHQPTPF